MVHRTHSSIVGTFVQFLREKFGITVLEDHCVYELGKKICGLVLSSVNEQILQSSTANELLAILG